MMKKQLATTLWWLAAGSAAWAGPSPYYGAVDYGTVNLSGQGGYSSPSSLTVSGGYRYRPDLQFEGGLTLVGSTTADVPGVGRVSVDQSILSAVAIGLLPLNPSVSVFGKAGLGMHNGEINLLPDDLVLGAGLQFVVHPRVSLRVQYESLGRQKIPSAPYKADVSRLAIGAVIDLDL